jgi:diguanylate cyclase (GGDEF)-like protein/PAS domain S-box-containing protein
VPPWAVGLIAATAVLALTLLLDKWRPNMSGADLRLLWMVGGVAAVVLAAASTELARRRHRLRASEAAAVARAFEREERLRLILGSLHEGLIFHDRHGRIVEYNEAATTILGVPEDGLRLELSDEPPWSARREDGTELAAGDLPVAETLRTGQPLVGRVMGVERPGRPIVWLTTNTQPVLDADGAVDGVILTFTDTTAERAALAALRSSEARFAALVERGSDIICVVDAAGQFTYASPASDRLLGSGSMAVGRSFYEIVHPDDVDRIERGFAGLAADHGAVGSTELRVHGVDGEWHRLEVVATNRLDDPDIRGIITNVRDVTERTEAVEALSWQAFHDPLTGLPNRTLLLEQVGAALDRSRAAGEHTALLFLDLDRFKNVNDTMGHEAGDRLLVEIAERLRGTVRAGDTVARLGGDEFIVLAESLVNPDEATYLADRVRMAVARPVALPQGTVTLTTSVGIAIDARHRPATLLRDADTALYKAKEHGRDRWEIFDDSLRTETIRRVAAEQIIRRALDEDGLRVHYQPIVDLATGRVVGAEALLRIMGPHGELLTPSSFIAIAEDTGLIVPIGAGVLDDACRQLALWREEMGDDAPPTVSVNLSARQLSTTAFPDMLRRTLERHDVVPEALTLELTESILIEAGRAALDTVEAVHELGVRLAIDDFGTGYSSLAYLKRFPVDIVKVDRSFVDGLGEQAHDTEIVRAVLALGQSLGLTTVAEGVETPTQLAMLRELGCDRAQGYLLGRPVPSDELADAVRRIRATLVLG